MAPRASRSLKRARLSSSAQLRYEGPKSGLVYRGGRKGFRLRVGVYGASRSRAVKAVRFLIDGKKIPGKVVKRKVRGVPTWFKRLQPTAVPAGSHAATAVVRPKRGKVRRLRLRLQAVDCPPATFSAKISTRGTRRRAVNLRLRLSSNGPQLGSAAVRMPRAAVVKVPRKPRTRKLGTMYVNVANQRHRYPLSLPRKRRAKTLTLARRETVRVTLRQGRKPLLRIVGLPDSTVSADVSLRAARSRTVTIMNPCRRHKFKATLVGSPAGRASIVSRTPARVCGR